MDSHSYLESIDTFSGFKSSLNGHSSERSRNGHIGIMNSIRMLLR